MKLDLPKKDVWAGLMLIVVGSAAMFIASGYRFGSALRMGPGFFPTLLGAMLIVFGICIMMQGLRSSERIQENLSIRALILLPLSLVIFGLLIETTGFIPSIVALIFLSAAAGKEFKIVEVLFLTVVLTVASTALFIWGLELPYPMIKGL